MYLRRCLPGSEDLCDLILVAGQERFPAHSQYLASHSHFIRQLILETGPFSWQHPLIIDKILHGHSSASVQLLLFGVYNLGILSIGSPDLAWQLSKLTDQLNCPNMLRHCRLYLNQMPMCQPDDALHWLAVTAHEAELEGLHANCASKIAADFDRVAQDKRLTSLPTAHLMRIMAVMSHQNALQLQANKQMCQVCRQSEQQAFRLGRKRKLLADMREPSASDQSSSDSDSESGSQSEDNDAAAAAVAAAAGPAAPSGSSSSDDDSGSEEEEGPDPAPPAAAAAGDAVVAAVAGLQEEQSSSEESESEEDSSSEDDSLPGPQAAVGNKPASEERSSSEEESSSEDDSKPGPQAASAADDSSSEEESSDEESSDGE